MTTQDTVEPDVIEDPPPTGPPNATADQVRFVFEFLGLTAGDERVERIVGEIESGQRNLLDVRNDLMKFMAEQDPNQDIKDIAGGFIDRIFEGEGEALGGERRDRLIGEVLEGSEGDIDTGRSFADILSGLQAALGTTPQNETDGSAEVQGVTLPSDVTRLLKVTGEGGVGDEYYVQGDAFGQTFSFLIGDQAAFDAMFPDGITGFESYETLGRNQFINSDAFNFIAGTIDEIHGSTESLQGQIQRDLEALGLEGLPSWIMNDDQAMLAMATAHAEGWSANRLQVAMSETTGFKERFVGFDQWYNEQEHGTIGDAIGSWAGLEKQFTTALRDKRGRDTDTSTAYLGSLITAGWGVGQFVSLLEGEQQLRTNTAAMDNLNEILAASGQQTLSPDEMVDFFMDSDEFESFEIINDALRGAALEDQGITLSTEQMVALGEGTSLGVASVGTFSEAARQAGLGIAANFNEVQRGKLGISDEIIVALAFQDKDLLPEGTTLAQAELTLQQLGRERQSLAGGTGGPTAFQDDQGRLRVQGLGG